MRNRSKYPAVIWDNIRIIGISVLTIVFLLVSMVMIRAGATQLLLFPPALLMIIIAFIAIDKFLILTVFLVPVSIQLRFIIPDTSADLFLPTEPMLALMLVLMIFKVFHSKEISRKILLHPVSVISFCMLGWCFITSLTSTLPAVSIKSAITKLWFFAGFFLLAAEIFRKPERVRTYFCAYITGMIPVVIYYLIRMLQTGIFNQEAAHSMIRPFFNDHTAFGASLAFCIPIMFYLLNEKETSKTSRVVLSFLLLLFSAAFVFSYSRAAWLSLAAAVFFTSFVILRISWKLILPAMAIIISIVFISWPDIMIRLNENRQESTGNLTSQIQSIANIRSDASNMERINRWKSALRLFKEKPLMGWGPATYQFQYAPFQMASEKTIISTNYGEGGNSHSEYMGSLVDSGIPGLVLYIILLFVSIRKGIIIYGTQSNKQTRFLILTLIAGMITYVIHGGLNNFLDTDKISALFWGMIAAITALDIRLKEEEEEI